MATETLPASAGTAPGVLIAAHRHEMADDALGEITEVAGALQHLIERHDVTGSVTKLSRGMLGRIKVLSAIASESIEVDDAERRSDDEILRDLTGLPAGALSSASSGCDPSAAAQPAASSPATDDPIEVARSTIAGLQAWRLMLPDAQHINARSGSNLQLVLRTMVERLESVFDGPGNDLPARQAAALLQSVEGELWKVCTFELDALSVEWCTRVVGLVSEILAAAVQAQAVRSNVDDARNGTQPAAAGPAAGPAAGQVIPMRATNARTGPSESTAAPAF